MSKLESRIRYWIKHRLDTTLAPYTRRAIIKAAAFWFSDDPGCTNALVLEIVQDMIGHRVLVVRDGHIGLNTDTDHFAK